MVPGIICVLLMESLVILTAMAIVREKERGTIEQLIVTPIRPYELILGKAIPFVGLGYINITVVILVGHVLVRRRRSAAACRCSSASPGSSSSPAWGWACVVSAISNTQQQASMAGQFVLLPEHVLLGLHVPDRQHAAAGAEAHLPHPAALLHHHRARHLPEGRRLGGAAGRGGCILLVYGVLILALATSFFRKRLR